MPIITYPLNGIEYDASDAETYLCTRTRGVYSSEDHFSISITGSRQVTISAGLAWINNGDFRGKSVVSTEPISIDVPAASGTLSRKDLIVLRFDSDKNESVITLKAGTESAMPAIPAVTREGGVYELGLYAITVGVGTVSVTQSDITSLLLDEEYCGIMRDGVTGIPTSQLQEQAKQLIDSLNAAIQEELSEIVSASVTSEYGIGTPTCEVILNTETGKIEFSFKNLRAEPALPFTVTLSAANWSDNAQTVSDNRFFAVGYVYTVAPQAGSYLLYSEAQIYAYDVTKDGQMLFRCGGTTPTTDLVVNICRMEAVA